MPIDRNLKLKIPAEATDAVPLLRHRLGASLRAVYLHGSAVGAGLRKRSDVDLLAVVDDEMPAPARASLTDDLMAVSGRYPTDPLGRRPLEVIIFRLADLDPLAYPARAAFVYGEWLRASLEAGGAIEPASSPEYTLALAQARLEAIPLFGPDIRDVTPEIAAETIRRAIADLLPALAAGIEGDERNVLLTLARMWRTAIVGDFVSKDAAAGWAGPQLSATAAAIVAIARNAYLGDGYDDLHTRNADVALTAEEIRRHIRAALEA